MKNAQPRGLSGLRINRLLSKARRETSVASRIEILSRHFLGYPYKPNPLIGSSETAEVFTISLDGFDCVTYIETIVALARATKAEDFIEELREMRYEQGRVKWERRNHYMTQWIRNNRRRGIIRPIPTSVPTASKERILDAVPGLAARRARVRYAAKRSIPKLAAQLQSGDLIFFVSTRRNLDVFHAGIIVRNDKGILLRHASRSQGVVIEQKLSDFLSANRTAGVIVMRPREIAPYVRRPN